MNIFVSSMFFHNSDLFFVFYKQINLNSCNIYAIRKGKFVSSLTKKNPKFLNCVIMTTVNKFIFFKLLF